MAILIGLSGNVSVGVDAKTPVAFTDYGTPPPTNVLTGGWNAAKYYWPETDANGDIVVHPGATTIAVMCDPNGKSFTDVINEQGLNGSFDVGQVATNIKNNPGWGYGTTAALALDLELMQVLVQNHYSENFKSPLILLRRGSTFAGGYLIHGNNRGSFERPGESAIRPVLMSAYGDPILARPYFDGPAPRMSPGCCNTIFSKQGRGHEQLIAGSHNFGIDDIFVDSQSTLSAGNHPGTTMQSTTSEGFRRAFMRRLKLLDVSIKVPTDANGYWTFSTDRGSSMYLAVGIYVNISDIFSLLSGWAIDYTQGGIPGSGQPTDDRSHGGYGQHSMLGNTVRGMFIMRPNFNAFQFRQGAVVHDLVADRPNSGFFFGAQIEEGNFSYAHRVTHVGGGWKQWAGNINGPGSPTTVAEGPVVNMPNFPVYEFLQVNSGTGAHFSTTGGTEVANGEKLVTNMGQQVRGVRFAVPTAATNLVGSFSAGTAQNFVLANWGALQHVNVAENIADQLALLSFPGWLDQHLATTGSTLDDFETWMRAEPEPWIHYKSIHRYFGGPVSWGAPEPTGPVTCTFQPASEAPPKRADIDRNWLTGHLPRDGDSIEINDDGIEWNGMTVDAPAVDLGPLADNFTIYGGKLKTASLTADAAHTVVVDGGKLEIGGRTGSPIHIRNEEGEVILNNSLTDIGVSNRWGSLAILAQEGETFTLPSGSELNVYGSPVHDNQYAKRVGVDGFAGGTASIVINGELNFRPGVWMRLSGTTPGSKLLGIRGGVNPVVATDSLLPNDGDIITSSGGASGVVRRLLNTSPSGGNRDWWIYVTDVTGGTFADGETLSATTLYMREIYAEGTGTFATINGAPSVSMSCIGEVKSGRGPQVGELPSGFDAEGRCADPNVVSQLTLGAGATVAADTTGLAPGTYDLIDVDVLTPGASLPAGLSIVGNRLVLTVT